MLGLLIIAAGFASPITAQQSGKAMKLEEMIGLLESGVESPKVAEAAQEYGIAFEMNAEAERQLRDAGATDDLLKTLRKLAAKAKPSAPSAPSHPPASKPAGPAVLMVEVTPGGAQVYVDDEPAGTTSQAGRLKLSQLAPGEHRVRVSLAGHNDIERSVQLIAGQTTPFSGTLEAARPTEPAKPPASPPVQPPQSGTSGDPASLGILMAPQAPQGIQGVYINDVVPGGPAQRAGLRTGLSIVSVNGQAVYSPQDLIQIVSRVQPGQVILIGYTDGRNVQTTRAQLVARSTLPAATPTATSPANPAGAMAQSQPFATFTVAHDHGSAGKDYCLGVIAIGGGAVRFRSTNGVHEFEFPVSEIREARRNAVYLSALGAFHIRLKQGTNYNFVLLNATGHYQPPDPVLSAISRATGTN